jgi:hypothetical protein
LLRLKPHVDSSIKSGRPIDENLTRCFQRFLCSSWIWK